MIDPLHSLGKPQEFPPKEAACSEEGQNVTGETI